MEFQEWKKWCKEFFKDVWPVRGEVRHSIKGQKEDKGKRHQSGVNFINIGKA